MKRILLLLLSFFVLVGFTGCADAQQEAPALLEPVGVWLDCHEVRREDIYELTAYDGQIVPYVAPLQFTMDGKLGQMKVTLGQQVAKGQILACLDTTALSEEMKQLEEEIAHLKRLGSYADRIQNANISILKTELAQMRAEGATEQACHLKELDIEEKELELTHQQQLRYFDIRSNQEILDKLRVQLEHKDIVAPFDGRVVYIGATEPGTSISGYTTVICLADENRLTLQTEYIAQAEIDNASKVFVKIGDEVYDVSYIPYDSQDYLSKRIAGVDVYSNFAVMTDAGVLESGQYAGVMVYRVYKQNVLTVPINAIYKEGSIRYVYKLVDNQRIRCNVSVGMVTNTEAEILDGLQVGDVVYVKN